MKRIMGGIVCCLAFLIAIPVASDEGDLSIMLPFAPYLLAGCLLIFFGARFLSRKKRIVRSVKALRASGAEADITAVVNATGLSEYVVRKTTYGVRKDIHNGKLKALRPLLKEMSRTPRHDDPQLDLVCPHCGVQLEGTNLAPRETVNCPSCNQEFQLPETETPPEHPESRISCSRDRHKGGVIRSDEEADFIFGKAKREQVTLGIIRFGCVAYLMGGMLLPTAGASEGMIAFVVAGLGFVGVLVALDGHMACSRMQRLPYAVCETCKKIIVPPEHQKMLPAMTKLICRMRPAWEKKTTANKLIHGTAYRRP